MCGESLGMRLVVCGESLGMKLVVCGESLGSDCTLECVCIGCRTIPMLDIKSVILHVPVKRTLAHFHKYC